MSSSVFQVDDRVRGFSGLCGSVLETQGAVTRVAWDGYTPSWIATRLLTRVEEQS